MSNPFPPPNGIPIFPPNGVPIFPPNGVPVFPSPTPTTVAPLFQTSSFTISSLSDTISFLEGEISSIQKQIDDAVSNNNFQSAASLKTIIDGKKNELLHHQKRKEDCQGIIFIRSNTII